MVGRTGATVVAVAYIGDRTGNGVIAPDAGRDWCHRTAPSARIAGVL